MIQYFIRIFLDCENPYVGFIQLLDTWFRIYTTSIFADLIVLNSAF